MSDVEIFVQFISWILIIGGTAFTLIGAIGILRFPNFWMRLHAVSVSDSAGMLLLMAGMCLQSGLTLITVKLVIIAAFLFVTGPASTHAAADAAQVSGLKPPRIKKEKGGKS